LTGSKFSAITPAEGDAFLTSAMMPNESALSDFLKPRNAESFRAFSYHSAVYSISGSISVLLWAMISAKRFIFRKLEALGKKERFICGVRMHRPLQHSRDLLLTTKIG
jgi:hypothetical protein